MADVLGARGALLAVKLSGLVRILARRTVITRFCAGRDSVAADCTVIAAFMGCYGECRGFRSRVYDETVADSFIKLDLELFEVSWLVNVTAL